MDIGKQKWLPQYWFSWNYKIISVIKQANKHRGLESKKWDSLLPAPCVTQIEVLSSLMDAPSGALCGRVPVWGPAEHATSPLPFIP